MNYKMIINTISRIMLVNAVLMIAPLLVSVIYRDGQVMPFVYTIAIFLALGGLGLLIRPKKRDIYAKEGMVIVAVIWIICSVFGGLPFWFSGQVGNFADCVFESASGFSTTGSTILTDVEAMSKSLLFWRSLTHWIGGMGVLVFVTAILSSKNERTTHIMRAEMPGPKVGKLAAKWQFSIRILYVIYVTLTALEFILLLIGKMNVFDALVHAFSTAGTGGFSSKNASIGFYDSAYIDYVTSIFMILFGVNFNLYYLIVIKQFAQIKNNSELKIYLGIIIGATVLIALNILRIYGTFSHALRYSLFQVAAVVSTTGYATADFCRWPVFSQMILFLLMFVGGSAGSTSGGLKVIRVSIVAKSAVNEIKRSFSPRSVLTVKNDGKSLDAAVVKGVMGYMMVYIVVMAESALILSLDRLDFTTIVTAVVTALNNVGPGLGKMIGPTGNFSDFSVLSKIVLTFDMLAGRLELFSMLALFSPTLWRK